MVAGIKISFWYNEVRYSFIFDMEILRIGEILICIEEQYKNKRFK